MRYHRFWNASLAIASVMLAFASRDSAAQRTVRDAEIDSTGRVRVVLSDRQVVSPPSDSGQAAVEQLAISPDRRVVGWLVLYPDCCTTYPIPLKLVLLRASGDRSVIGNALPIWQWAFTAGGRSVVIRQAPVHGPGPMYFERWDIRHSRVTATATVDSITSSTPEWIRVAMPKQPSSSASPNPR